MHGKVDIDNTLLITVQSMTKVKTMKMVLNYLLISFWFFIQIQFVCKHIIQAIYVFLTFIN